MGYIKHNTIIVIGYDEKLKDAHTKAVELFSGLVTEIKKSWANEYESFAIITSGSKSGWGDKEKWEDAEYEFFKYCEKFRWEDNGVAVDVASIEFGGDDNNKYSYTNGRPYKQT